MESSIQGFTLIELLIVIAVIATLVAVLFPVLASARIAANNSSAQSLARNMVTVSETQRAVETTLQLAAASCQPGLIGQLPPSVDTCQYRQDPNATYILVRSKTGAYFHFDGQRLQGPLAQAPGSW